MSNATVTVVVPPTITKAFGAAAIGVGETTSLSFTIANPNALVALTGVGLTDTLPGGLAIATPNGLNPITGCNGAVPTAPPGTNTITLTGAALLAGDSCTFAVNVTAVLAGVQTNTTSVVTSANGGTGSTATAALNVLPPPDAYQIRYLANLNVGDGVVNITNAGALGADPFGPNAGTIGRICVNVYAFSPDEQEIACCSCLVTPNAVVHLSPRSGIITNTLTGVTPNSIVVKLLATVPLLANGTGGTQAGPFTGSVCDAASPFNVTNLAPGARAWATTLHALPTSPVTYGLTEGPFVPAPLSAGELNKLTSLCRFIVGNGSGAGICKTCTLGGLGAEKR
ncbi:MAG: hypothetical protein M3Z32_00565 [Acidobacteriota bacterium]|nr:hypothetical protein [Acidobacteriota bacterium]